MAPGGVDLIEGDDHLERDQHDDDDFEAQRAARVDDIGKRVGRFRDHGKLSVEGVEALFAGPADIVAAMIASCRRGPSMARVDTVRENDGRPDALKLRRAGERFTVLPTI